MNVLDFLLICVNYNNEDDTIHCVESFLLTNKDSKIHVLVVDNSEMENDIMSSQFKANSNVTLLRPESNLGFYNGASWGLKVFLSKAPIPFYICVSNTDLIFNQSDFVKHLKKYHDNLETTVIAPSIKSNLTGVDQNPQIRNRPSRHTMKFYTIVYKYYITAQIYWILSILKNKFLKKSCDKKFISDVYLNPSKIYAPHGSIVIYKNNYFKKGATINNKVFLFGETIQIAEQCLLKNLNVVYDKRLKVIHKEHATTNIFRSKKVIRFQWEASIHCYKSFFK